MSSHRIRFELNGGAVDVRVPAERLLVDLLRDDLGLTGTKVGCGVGVCGACTVLVDGEPMTGCLLLATQVDGRAVRTIEGLARRAPPGGSEGLTPLQEAFIRDGGFQCGICTPGQILAATALLEASPHPSEGEIREAMKGNLCRCTGYYGIMRSIRSSQGAPPLIPGGEPPGMPRTGPSTPARIRR